MPRRAFWSQTRSARREILLTEEHGQRVRDPFCQRWASRLQATEARSNALLCQRGLGRNGAAFPFNPRGDLSPSGFGQLHRPSGKCCGEELKKMRRICVPNWMQPCRAGPPIGGASSFPQFSPKPPCTLPSEVLEFKWFVAVSTDSQSSSQQQALLTWFSVRSFVVEKSCGCEYSREARSHSPLRSWHVAVNQLPIDEIPDAHGQGNDAERRGGPDVTIRLNLCD